jgi:hypothetical protein
MRKHRRVGVVIAVLLLTGVRLHPPSSPHHHVGATNAGRFGFQLASATLPASAQDTTVAPGDEALHAMVHPLRTHHLLAQSALMAYLQAHIAPPAPPPPPPRPSPPPPPPSPPGPGSGDVWAALRQCESGGNYADNTGNGYYGAYQFSLGTWQGLGMTGIPSDAPPATQDQAARNLQSRSGWGQWPACAHRLSLV